VKGVVHDFYFVFWENLEGEEDVGHDEEEVTWVFQFSRYSSF
jgi:hypothetical protein